MGPQFAQKHQGNGFNCWISCIPSRKLRKGKIKVTGTSLAYNKAYMLHIGRLCSFRLDIDHRSCSHQDDSLNIASAEIHLTFSMLCA